MITVILIMLGVLTLGYFYLFAEVRKHFAWHVKVYEEEIKDIGEMSKSVDDLVKKRRRPRDDTRPRYIN